MDSKEIAYHIDHTELNPCADWMKIVQICNEAIKYKTACVCVPPSYVKSIKENYQNQLKICTVIGFPLGYQTTSCKVFETKDAIKNGADEIDMVINLGFVKNKDFDRITQEIQEVRKVCVGKILKVIIETCYLEEEEIKELCHCIALAKADYIKTSTGFGSSGAQLKDIEYFVKYLPKSVKIKAAGGIRTPEQIKSFIDAGCDRIGSSSGVRALFKNE